MPLFWSRSASSYGYVSGAIHTPRYIDIHIDIYVDKYIDIYMVIFRHICIYI